MKVNLVRQLATAFVLLTATLVSGAFAQSPVSAQEAPSAWLSNVLWYPSLEESGVGVAEFVNTIDAACSVDVDPVQSTNGAGADGAVYGFAVSWTCAPGTAPAGVDSWYSTMVWRPTIADTGIALSETLNEIDGSCTVDVDPVTASNGAGPEGPVYAYVVTWACRSGAPTASGPWLSNMVWHPTFADAGIALAELLNQIEATCTVDVDDAISTNGATADGPLVGFAVSWSCPA